MLSTAAGGEVRVGAGTFISARQLCVPLRAFLPLPCKHAVEIFPELYIASEEKLNFAVCWSCGVLCLCACSSGFLLITIGLWSVVTGIGKHVLAARQHNSRAECKQQAANAPLQYARLCIFKLLHLASACIKCILGSAVRNRKILIADNCPSW